MTATERPPTASPTPELPYVAQWCARNAIDVMAISVGIATLPVSLPMMIAGSAVSGPRRLLFDYLDGVKFGRNR